MTQWNTPRRKTNLENAHQSKYKSMIQGCKSDAPFYYTSISHYLKHADEIL